MLQLIGRLSCKETRKAERFLKERKIGFHFVDLDKKELSPGELKSIFSSILPSDLINKNSKEFEKKGLKYMDFSPEEELLLNQKLLATPVIREKNRAILGCDEALLKSFIK
jgi:arsenate reductase-like glutaredoxin family protein